MTFFRIFIALVALYILVFIIGLILLGIVMVVVAFSQSKFSGKILMAAFYLIMSPLLILGFIPLGLGFIQDTVHRLINPEGYAEKKRLRKNYTVIESLKYHDNTEEKDNILSPEEA